MMASSDLSMTEFPGSSKVKKPFKRPFAVPIVSAAGEQVSGRIETIETNTNYGEKTNSFTTGHTDVGNCENESQGENTSIPSVKKKANKIKSAAFKAPSMGASSELENTLLGIAVDGKVKTKKKKKTKEAVTPSASGDNSGSCETLAKAADGHGTMQTTKPRTKKKTHLQKLPVVRKPIKSMTDEEYDAMFDAVMGNKGEVEIQLISSEDYLKEDKKDIVQEDEVPVEEDFEALSHHDEELQNVDESGEAGVEAMNEVVEDNAEDDEEYYTDHISMELIQLQNEITPDVSENEASNQHLLKPVPLPPKQKKTVKKNQLPPQQLWTSEVKPAKFAKKKSKKKVSKQLQMQSREINSCGTWVQCVNNHCMKWRHLKDTDDPSILPERWTCDLNTEEQFNSCDKPEVNFDESEHEQTFIYTHFTEGSVVWAKMMGYPWWPAMVEIDPDVGEYFELDPNNQMLPEYYHVVFFDDKVSRAWMRTTNIKTYSGTRPEQTSVTAFVKGQLKHSKELKAAEKNAQEALNYPLKERIQKYSFASRFRGSWGKVSEEPEVVLKLTKRTRNKRQVSHDNDETVSPSTCTLEIKNKVRDVQDEGMVDNLDEILDNAEDILSNAGGVLDSMEDGGLFDYPEDDFEFVPASSPKKMKPKKIRVKADDSHGKNKRKKQADSCDTSAENVSKVKKIKTEIHEAMETKAELIIKTEKTKFQDVEKNHDVQICGGSEAPTEKKKRKKKKKNPTALEETCEKDIGTCMVTETSYIEEVCEGRDIERDQASQLPKGSEAPTEKKKRKKKKKNPTALEETCEKDIGTCMVTETSYIEEVCEGRDIERDQASQLPKGKKKKKRKKKQPLILGPESKVELEMNNMDDVKGTENLPADQNLGREDSCGVQTDVDKNKTDCVLLSESAAVGESQPSEPQPLQLAPHHIGDVDDPISVKQSKQIVDHELQDEKPSKKAKKNKQDVPKKKNMADLFKPVPVSISSEVRLNSQKTEDERVEKMDVAEFDSTKDLCEPITQLDLISSTRSQSQAPTEENSDPFDVDEHVQAPRPEEENAAVTEHSDPFDAEEGMEVFLTSTKDVNVSSQDVDSKPFDPLEE